MLVYFDIIALYNTLVYKNFYPVKKIFAVL
jgi:hypothetical protein